MHPDSKTFFYENVTCVTADFEILQHLNLILQYMDFFLSRNLKNDILHSIFISSSFHFILCAIKKINDTLALFCG